MNIPGPGHYNPDLTKSMIIEGTSSGINTSMERPNTQSVYFKSNTDRFTRFDNANPNIRILTGGGGKRTAMTAHG